MEAPPAQGYLVQAIEQCEAFLGLAPDVAQVQQFSAPVAEMSAMSEMSTEATSAAPQITSAASTSFAEEQQANFTVTSVGPPTPTLAVSGELPSGVAFNDYGNGTGAIAGEPSAGTAAVYALVITASSSAGTATQDFTLTVAGKGAGELVSFQQSVVSCLLSIAEDVQLMRMRMHQ